MKSEISKKSDRETGRFIGTLLMVLLLIAAVTTISVTLGAIHVSPDEIVKILASEYKMAVGGGAGYQGNGEYFLRFNIGCPRETLEKGMEILAQFVADKKEV